MSDIARLKKALVEADRRGDKKAAAVIANRIKGGLQQEPTARDNLIGGLEAVGTVGSSIVAEPLSGIAGLAQAINPFAEEGAGARAVEATREALTYMPETRAGQEAVQGVGEALQPVGDALMGAEQAVGDAGYALGEATGIEGAPEMLGAAGASLPTLALEALGLGVGKGAIKSAPKLAEGADKAIEGVVEARKAIPQTRAKQRIGELIEQGSTDKITAKYQLEAPKQAGEAVDAVDKFTETVSYGAPRVKRDKVAKETIAQGFDEGVIAAVKGGSATDKRIMLEMVNRMKKGRENKLYAMHNRPSDLAGNSLVKRTDYILQTNKQAGKDLNKAANGLKGTPINYDGVVQGFVDDLADLDISINAKTLEPNFTGSIIEGNEAAEKAVRNIVRRMRLNSRPLDAYEGHRLKKFIDEQVSYGKAAEGLTGQAERVLKRLRSNVNEAVGEVSPDYKNANQVYSDTIGVLNDLQKEVGKKIDLSSPNAAKSLGTDLRRLMGNTKGRVNLMEGINEAEAVAKKYGADFDDDIMTLTLFADELDAVFKPTARTSFEGLIGRQVQKGAQTAVGGRTLLDAGVEGVGAAANKVRGINEENAIKSIERLLQR